MIVRLKMFAAARQLAGTALLELELPRAATVADLRARLVDEVPGLAPISGLLMFAVNQEYAADTVAIEEDADIACIPPVSGG